jgi:hypothetical protein
VFLIVIDYKDIPPANFGGRRLTGPAGHFFFYSEVFRSIKDNTALLLDWETKMKPTLASVILAVAVMAAIPAKAADRSELEKTRSGFLARP